MPAASLETLLLVTVSVPELLIAAAPPLVLPILTRFRFTVALGAIGMRKAPVTLRPSIVIGPLMTRRRVMSGNTLASVIVPLTLNTIASLPVPAVQPFLAAPLFAAVIAS